MRKLDQEKLLTALKHENLKDHVELDEEDQEFLSKVSKGKNLNRKVSFSLSKN